MARITDNIFTHGLSGNLGNFNIKRHHNGHYYVSKKGRRRPGLGTAAQKIARDNFRMAIKRAKAILLDAAKKRKYIEAAGDHRTAYNVAVSDSLTPPSVLGIDIDHYRGQVGDRIIIKAIDNFEVESVTVTIRAANGHLYEKGKAVIAIKGPIWVYTCVVINPYLPGTTIEAVARDIPGNSTSLTKGVPVQ